MGNPWPSRCKRPSSLAMLMGVWVQSHEEGHRFPCPALNSSDRLVSSLAAARPTSTSWPAGQWEEGSRNRYEVWTEQGWSLLCLWIFLQLELNSFQLHTFSVGKGFTGFKNTQTDFSFFSSGGWKGIETFSHEPALLIVPYSICGLWSRKTGQANGGSTAWMEGAVAESNLKLNTTFKTNPAYLTLLGEQSSPYEGG